MPHCSACLVTRSWSLPPERHLDRTPHPCCSQQPLGAACRPKTDQTIQPAFQAGGCGTYLNPKLYNLATQQQTKLSNPHFKPEIAAQTTLVNFCVTEKGLEDQLLALVVEHERPDLQEQAQQLVRQLAEYTISLRELEDSLLFRLDGGWGFLGGEGAN